MIKQTNKQTKVTKEGRRQSRKVSYRGIKHQAMKTSALDAGEWSASPPEEREPRNELENKKKTKKKRVKKIRK
jgi:hypothetical protein